MDYYRKYLKYKIKYITLKTNNINIKDEKNIIQSGGKYQLRIDDNINNKYPTINKTEVNIFGYTHSSLCGGGCMF
jgi:hypothetical protein